jgi:hypothetical protein
MLQEKVNCILCTRNSHLTYTEQGQSSPQPILLSKIHFNIIFPTIPRYTLFSFPQVSPTKPRTYPSSLPYVLHDRSVSFRDLITRIITDEAYRSQSSSLCVQSPPLACYLISPRSKDLPQHPILEHLQPVSERPIFTPI